MTCRFPGCFAQSKNRIDGEINGTPIGEIFRSVGIRVGSNGAAHLCNHHAELVCVELLAAGHKIKIEARPR